MHAQILCIGGNGLFALFFGLVGLNLLSKGDFGPAVILLVLTVAAAYTLWVLLKFRKYLSAEETLEREVHIERLREELETLKANNGPGPPS
jgi:hypothetical protein